jgi:hypothetical protein
VDLAWELTDREGWKLSSYLVLGVSPLDYSNFLDRALDCLFRSTEENGFWDSREEKIVRALEYDLDGAEVPYGNGTGNGVHSPTWSVDDSIEWRYAPFALLGAMQWRASALGSAEYDGKLERELTYFTERLKDRPTRDRMPSYGIGPLIAAFSLADSVFENSAYLDTAHELHVYAKERFEFDHAEDCLLAYGWSRLYEREQERERSAGGNETGTSTADLRAALDDAFWEMNERLGGEGLFEFESPTTCRHQN